MKMQTNDDWQAVKDTSKSDPTKEVAGVLRTGRLLANGRCYQTERTNAKSRDQDYYSGQRMEPQQYNRRHRGPKNWWQCRVILPIFLANKQGMPIPCLNTLSMKSTHDTSKRDDMLRLIYLVRSIPRWIQANGSTRFWYHVTLLTGTVCNCRRSICRLHICPKLQIRTLYFVMRRRNGTM